VCAVGSSATLVVVSTPSFEEDLGTPRRRRRVERVRTSIARDEAGPVADVVVRCDDAIRDIPLAPLAHATLAVLEAPLGSANGFVKAPVRQK
jgi:hypothetical protein